MFRLQPLARVLLSSLLWSMLSGGGGCECACYKGGSARGVSKCEEELGPFLVEVSRRANIKPPICLRVAPQEVYVNSQ